MPPSPWDLRIHQTLPGRLGSSIDAFVAPDGRFLVRVSAYLRGRQEIGQYEHVFPPERIAAFEALVNTSGLWGQAGAGRLAPDTPNVSFRRHELGTRTHGRWWALHELPAELEPVMDAFHTLLDEARASPAQVLAGKARWLRPSVRPRERLELEFTLTNPGTRPITIQSPRTPPQGSASSLTLLLERPPLDDEDPEDCVTRLELGPDVLARTGAGGPVHAAPNDVEHLTLQPGAELGFLASPGAYLAPGTHRAVLLFRSVIPERPGTRQPKGPGMTRALPAVQPDMAHAVTSGELAMELTDLTVTPPP